MCHRGRFERAFSVAPGMERHPEIFLKVSIVIKSIKINTFLDHILTIRDELSLSLSILNTEEYKIEQ